MMIFMRAILLLALSSMTTASIAASIEWQCPNDRKDFKVKGVDPAYLEKWKALFEESERLERTAEGKAYNPPMLKAHNAFYPEVVGKCEEDAKKANDQFFLAIAIVSSTGEVQEFLTMPPRPEYACYAKNIVGRRYPAPPADHYPVGFMEILSEDASTPSGKCIRRTIDLILERDRAQNSVKDPASVGHP